MAIPGGDGLGGRRNIPLNPCVYEGEDEILADPPRERAEVVRLSQRVCEGGNEIAPDLQDSEEVEEHSSADLDVVEVVDTCALEVLAPYRREGEAVRFFVSAPELHPTFSAVGFINQGNTTLLECRMEAIHLYAVSCEPVDVVYNSAPCGWSSRNISVEAPEARLLRRSWDDFFAGCSSLTALRLQFCAGDGAYIVRAALRGYPHAHRIFVVAVAPSCTIDPALCFRVRHYRARGDLTSLCSGPGSVYPDYSVVPRSWESRGTLDFAFYSSTFQGFLRLEVLYFQLEDSSRYMHGDYDDESVRARILSNPNPYSIVNQRRAGELLRLLANFGIPIRYNCWINLVEEVLDEFPRDTFETGLVRDHIALNLFLIISQVAIGLLARGSNAIRLVALGIPVLRAVNVLTRISVYVIPRDQGRSSSLRRLALRSRLLNLLCLLYESAISCSLLVSGEASGFLVNGLLGYVIVRNLEVFCENIVVLYSPLRGRIQRWLTVVSEEDIGTRHTQNEEADRVGYIERAMRGTREIFAGVSTAVAGVSLAFAASSISNPSPSTMNNGTAGTTELSHWVILPIGVLSGIAGIVAVNSIVANVHQIIRMVRRLRQGAAVIPLVEVVPIAVEVPEEVPLVAIESDDRGHRSRRGHRLLEDPERRDSRVVEEIPLLELGPDNRGRRGRRLSESLEDPERRDSRVIEEVLLVEFSPGLNPED